MKNYKNNKYKCKNGIKVRSKSEMIISNFLTDHQVDHIYEKAIHIDSHPEHDIHPDFYISGIVTYQGRIIKDIYIEHWGLNTREYNQSKLYKIDIYKKLGVTLVCTYEKDMINPEESLRKKLINAIEGKINYFE